MSIMQLKYTRHAREQKNLIHNQEKNQSIGKDLQMTDLVDLPAGKLVSYYKYF